MTVSASARSASSWTHRLAILLAASALLLIVVGGTVTTLEAGDTEPSWSLRFWDWFQSPAKLLRKEGHIWEMSHRQLGTVVGFLAVAFALSLWRGEPRRWVRNLGWLVLLGVVVQGVLGGVRVLVVSDQGDAVRSGLGVASGAAAESLRQLFAILHAGAAYLLFALMTCLVWLTSRRWRDAGTELDERTGQRIRRWSVGLAAVVLVQLLFGAYLRHALEPSLGRLLLHVAGALLVGLAAAFVAFEVFSRHARIEALSRPALFVLLTVQVQIFLGILAFLLGSRRFGALLETGHQIVGPLLFAGSAILLLRAFRNLEIRRYE